jgi:hypothetical protein
MNDEILLNCVNKESSFTRRSMVLRCLLDLYENNVFYLTTDNYSKLLTNSYEFSQKVIKIFNGFTPNMEIGKPDLDQYSIIHKKNISITCDYLWSAVKFILENHEIEIRKQQKLTFKDLSEKMQSKLLNSLFSYNVQTKDNNLFWDAGFI